MHVDHMGASDALGQLLERSTLREPLVSGFPELDAHLGWFGEGDLIAFASASRGLRESVLHSLTWAAAIEQNRRVIYASPSESATQVVRALISSQLSRLNISRERDVTGSLHNKIRAAALHLATINSGRAFYQARSLENICRQHRPEVIILNDLQGCIREIGNSNLYTEVTLLLRALKTMARRHQATCIFTSQINRNCHRREVPSNQLHDLRDSGGIEDDSDIVIFISQAARAPSCIDANILKFRNGPLARLKLKLL